MHHPTSYSRTFDSARRPRGARPWRSRCGAHAVVAVVTLAASLWGASPSAAAADSTELENCSDGNNFCQTLTVEKPPIEPPPDETPSSTLNYCSPFMIQNDGTFIVDLCDHNGKFLQTVTLTPEQTRRRPNRSRVISSASGALNPPRPTIYTSPGYRSGLLVQTPTWLWLSPSYWRTYTTTIVVMGYVVTIFATPTVVRWNMGNGDSVLCVGPGTPWIFGFSDALSTCKYTYRNSSDGKARDRYKITATVTFVGSFTSVGLGGMRGPLGAVTRSSSVRAAVAEIQGLVV